MATEAVATEVATAVAGSAAARAAGLEAAERAAPPRIRVHARQCNVSDRRFPERQSVEELTGGTVREDLGVRPGGVEERRLAKRQRALRGTHARRATRGFRMPRAFQAARAAAARGEVGRRRGRVGVRAAQVGGGGGIYGAKIAEWTVAHDLCSI